MMVCSCIDFGYQLQKSDGLVPENTNLKNPLQNMDVCKNAPHAHQDTLTYHNLPHPWTATRYTILHLE